MDAVITYVNGLDPQWVKEYSETVGGQALAKRYRDWGTLKYLLRGIQCHIPFIRNVYLIVSSESQVPDWADRTELKVVLHKDIIPQDCLPLFNSASIEMFLHRIDGLDEQFVYFNDDFFPVSPCVPEDFFMDGKPVFGLTEHLFAGNLYKKQTRNSDRFARKAAGVSGSAFFIRPQHICAPMLKSQSTRLYEEYAGEILATVSPLREEKNLNQYVFTDYLYFAGLSIRRKMSARHFSLAVSSIRKISSFLREPDAKIACINDVQMPEGKYLKCRDALLLAFERSLPQKSRFEL